MKTAGGIIALISGVFGVIAAMLTLMVGGMGEAFEAEGSATVSLLGWGGLLFSFLVIVMGAVALGTRSRWNGGLIISASIIGAVLGGTLVAVTMILALVGGILVLAGSGKRQSVGEISNHPQLSEVGSAAVQATDPGEQAVNTYTEPAKKAGPLKAILIGGGLVVGSLAILVAGATFVSSVDGQSASGGDEAPAQMAVYQIGLPARVGDVEFTLLGVEIRDVVGSEFIKQEARPGEEFLAIRYTYKNVGNAPISTWNSPRVRLMDGNGQEYSMDVGASSSYAVEVKNDSNALSDINPGVTQSDSDVFVLGSDHLYSNTWVLKVSQAGQDGYFSLAEDTSVSEEETAPEEAVPYVPEADAEPEAEASMPLDALGPALEEDSGFSVEFERPAASEVVSVVGVVNVESWDKLNVRSTASADSEIVGHIPPEAAGVELLQCTGNADADAWLALAKEGAKPAGVWCEVYFLFADVDVRGWVNAWYLAPPSSNEAQECSMPENLSVGLGYTTARSRILEAGFVPTEPNADSDCYSDNVTDWNEKACATFPEIWSCSGTGQGLCIMSFTNSEGNVLAITTVNGSPISYDGEINSAVEVYVTSMNCE